MPDLQIPSSNSLLGADLKTIQEVIGYLYNSSDCISGHILPASQHCSMQESRAG